MQIVRNIMCRNRFQLLLRTVHFSDNTTISEDTEINTSSGFVKKVVSKSGEFLCIDETLVPFRGRLIFKQYIANKRHRFGNKLFKFCLEGG
jgi:hypothetical protein